MVEGNYSIKNLLCILFFGFCLQLFSNQIGEGLQQDLPTDLPILPAEYHRAVSPVPMSTSEKRLDENIQKTSQKKTTLRPKNSEITDDMAAGVNRGSAVFQSAQSAYPRGLAVPRSILHQKINHLGDNRGFITEDTTSYLCFEVTSGN